VIGDDNERSRESAYKQEVGLQAFESGALEHAPAAYHVDPSAGLNWHRP
jgi:hypothetical protein